MTYVKTKWKDRVVERPNTYTMTDNGNGTVTLTPVPGQIIERGTPLNAENLNKIEDAIVETNAQLSDVAHTINDVKYYGADPNKSDNTDAIQKALNNRGTVLISVPGTYITGTLTIHSDTHFKLDNGVILKLKDGTHNHILENDGFRSGNLNFNITIEGGKWDCNKDTNALSGAYSDDKWGGIAIGLNHIRNLTIKNVKEIGNAPKYCYLMANIENGYFENINLINGSDGLHFQAPCKNINIKNITGLTHDNMVAFTIGDYPNYVISEDGDFENISIDGVYSNFDLTAMDLIRLVGAGKNNNGTFKNIKINNVIGRTDSQPLIVVYNSDQAVPNDYLKRTLINNLEISNILGNINNATTPLVLLEGQIESVKLDSLNIKESCPTTCLVNVSNSTYIRNLELKNVVLNKQTPYEYKNLLTIDSPVKNLTISNLWLSLINSNYYFNLINASKSIDNLVIENSIIDLTKGRLYNADVNCECHMSIENCKINTVGLMHTVGLATLRLINSKITKNVTDESKRFVDLKGQADVRVLGCNCDMDNLEVSGISGAKFSINGSCIPYYNVLTSLTPLEGDFVRSTHPEAQAKGLYYYNGTEWEKK